ncbi:MAG TPA: hypothetical protein VII58_03220 [Acidobacteriaceae bacterium]
MFRTRHSRAPRTRLVARSSAAIILLLLFAAPLAYAANKSAPPAKPAAEYPAHDTHPDEQVTVAADPCLDPKDCPFFRVSYLQHGFLPVRVIFTNDSDHAIALDDARIQFISAANDKVQAATDDDLNRRVFNLRDTKPTHIPMVPIPIYHTPVDKKITDDGNDFGFSGTIVKAHSTLAGYLFYDIQGVDRPLKGAELYVKMVHTLDDDRKDLFSFSVPFDKWLAANSGAAKQ